MWMTKADLRYIIRNRVVLEVFPDVAMNRMYKIRLSVEAFGEDNWKFFYFLKEYIINSLSWSWIERFKVM